MKKKITLIVMLTTFFSYSQNDQEIIKNYLEENIASGKILKNDLIDWTILNTGTSNSTEINSCYVQQKYKGIEVFNAISNFSIKKGKVISVGERYIPNLDKKINTNIPKLSILEAVERAQDFLNIERQNNLDIIEHNENSYKIKNNLNSNSPITGKLIYHVTENENLKLSWIVSIYTPKQDHYWSVVVDAVTGEILKKYDLVLSCDFGKRDFKTSHSFHLYSNNFFKKDNHFVTENNQLGSYRVIPFDFESPNHSARKLMTRPENALASPFGWHDVNGVTGSEYTITRGNNVWALEDIDGKDQTTGVSPDGGTDLVFDFEYLGTSSTPSSYTKSAVTNLFYTNNVLHDLWYNYGFDEKNKNFQQNNYNKGGVANDYVIADAQDGSGTNNANFYTPDDGQNPRMQMFLFTGRNGGEVQTKLKVNSPASISREYTFGDNSFSPGHVDIPDLLTRDLVLFVDNTPDTSDACTAAINTTALNGKIAIIRRGTCTFISKAKLAQNAGAVAVIIVNNVDTPAITGMTGNDATLTIPVIMISKVDGEAIISTMANSSVNVTLSRTTSASDTKDGDFDNGIIAHEFGHGITNRLTGGSPYCLQNAEQAGEGWSDWFALIMQMQPNDIGKTAKGMGTFVLGQGIDGPGIRQKPYSTDMTINPKTFSSTNNDLVHTRGEFMAVVLWDLAWAYVDKYGFNNNKYTGNGGNNKVMQLVIDGLKLQPCSPTFIDFRTALIAADQATTGGKDYCLITEVFRRRGMGLNATSGSRDSALDQKEDFTAFPPGPNCSTLGINYFENEDMINVYPNPSNGKIVIQIDQYIGKLDLQIIDLNGRTVLNMQDSSFEIQKSIDLNHLSKGMYILKIKGDALNYSKKLIFK